MQNRSILISGAGIAGPALAYWLLRRGYAPTLVERSPEPRTGGYMIDFWGVGYDVAERMGLLPALRQDGYRIEEVRLVDRSGNRRAGFDAAVFRSATGDRFVSLLRGDLAHRIYGLLNGKVETIVGDSISSLNEAPDGVAVTFERAGPRRFDLVVGADGLHSQVRTLAFGDESQYERYLGYYTAAFSMAGYPHRSEGTYVSYSVPGGQIARYALRHDRSAFFFIFARDTRVPFGHHDVAAQKALLRATFEGTGWESREILDAMETADDLYFDAVAQIQLASWFRGRVALLGDAAFCPSLLAGQGSAFAMAGAYVLAHELASAGGEHLAAYAEYQRRFKPFVDAKQKMAVRMGGWFAPRTWPGIWLRNLITNSLRIPFVGTITARAMFADAFELPT